MNVVSLKKYFKGGKESYYIYIYICTLITISNIHKRYMGRTLSKKGRGIKS